MILNIAKRQFNKTRFISTCNYLTEPYNKIYVSISILVLVNWEIILRGESKASGNNSQK